MANYINGIILPQRLEKNGPMWGLGGVCDQNEEFVESSFYDGGWAKHGGKYEWSDEKYVDQTAVYVGMFYRHWGHFLIDLTNRLWYVQQLAKKNNDFLVAYLGDEEPDGNTLEFYKLLGVQENQLYHVKEPTRFREVIVPEQSFKSCEWYTDAFVRMFDEMRKNVEDTSEKFSEWRDIKKIYFTRRCFTKAREMEFGEGFFEKLFVNNGFKSVAPERLELTEQIYIWNHAEKIVCINGSIPLNVIFSGNNQLKLLVLNKTALIHENPYILLQARGISAFFSDIYKEPFRKYPKSLGEGPYLLWYTADFEKVISKYGYIPVMSEPERNRYFVKEYIKYCWAIIGIKRRLRLLLYKAVPQPVKSFRRRIASRIKIIA